MHVYVHNIGVSVEAKYISNRKRAFQSGVAETEKIGLTVWQGVICISTDETDSESHNRMSYAARAGECAICIACEGLWISNTDSAGRH